VCVCVCIYIYIYISWQHVDYIYIYIYVYVYIYIYIFESALLTKRVFFFFLNAAFFMENLDLICICKLWSTKLSVLKKISSKCWFIRCQIKGILLCIFLS